MVKGPVKRVEERLKLQKKPNMTRLEIKKKKINNCIQQDSQWTEERLSEFERGYQKLVKLNHKEKQEKRKKQKQKHKKFGTLSNGLKSTIKILEKGRG